MKQHVKANVKVIFALTLVHFTGDFYSSFTSPLFPLFVDKMGLSLAQVGTIAGINRLLAFIVQPPVGYLADQYQSRYFIFIGLLLPVIFIPLSGICTGFWTLLFATMLGSIGSSMFHPSVTGMIPVYSGNKSGFSMSVFNTGGTLAFGIGPLFITWYAARFGLELLPLTMIFGLCIAVYLYNSVPMPQPEGLNNLGFLKTIKQSLGSAWKVIVMIWAVMFLRAMVGQSFLTFMPVFYVEKGFSIVSAGVIFSLFTIAGTISGLTAGLVSDKIGIKPVFIFTHIIMTPILLLFLKLEGSWTYLGSILAGAAVLASLPLGVVMAQKLAPKGRSMVASLMMGFAYGLGGFAAPLVGKLADIYSIQTVLTGISFVPLLTLPIIYFFPNITGD
ncbi:MFS transporter [Desulfobacterales bacterium HSG17]|nr:MFS transporter [Desulfobacterales bacterium HSG17]